MLKVSLIERLCSHRASCGGTKTFGGQLLVYFNMALLVYTSTFHSNAQLQRELSHLKLTTTIRTFVHSSNSNISLINYYIYINQNNYMMIFNKHGRGRVNITPTLSGITNANAHQHTMRSLTILLM